MAKSKPEKLPTSKDEAIDVGGPSGVPPQIMSPTEWEKLLKEETAKFNLPLALRKTRRATAGMSKYTGGHDDYVIDEQEVFSKPVVKPKEMKVSTKRKLEIGSSGTSGKGKQKEKHKHKHKESESVEDYVPPSSKKQKIGALRDQDSRNDFYCWYCHKEGSVICCELCPRVYHTRCLKYESEPVGDWVCPVCQKVLESECVDTQSKAMAKLSVSQLSRLLNFALKRMKHQGTDSFQKPVSLHQFPDYASFVFNAMDLGTLEQNIKKNVYGSTYAFLEETKWILHNCIIFNGSHHKLTNRAKSIVKICDYEMNEIEICPNCYLSSCLKREDWFCEPCDPPHTIVWAKLQGFPYWQAKVLRESKGQVDVRFFGQHDRAWIPIASCYLISKESPITSKKHSSRLANASRELKIYAENIQAKFGSFEYYSQRTPYRPGMALPTNATNKSPIEKKIPVKSIKPLSGKPAAFMNGIRDAEASKQEEEMEEEEEDLPEESTSGMVPSKSRIISERSESASIDDDSFDSASQDDSSQWSVGSSQTSEKQEPSMSSEKSVVADCSQGQKSRMGGMKSVVKNTVIKASSEGVQEYLAKSVEFARKKLQDEADSPSRRPVPAGVFEISDRTLNIDKEKKSPSVQLLGKVHVSPKHLKRNLESSFETSEDEGKVTATSGSPKKHESTCGKNRTEQSKDSSNSSSPVKVKVEPKCAISVDGDGEPSSGSSLQSILPSKLPDPSTLEKVEISPPKTPPDSEIPSTSKGTPRSSDKFHMKLSKTIESMKASLGMESLETNNNSDSESESEVASAHDIEHDSDSSDDESSMEVDTKNEKAADDEKGTRTENKSEEESRMEVDTQNEKAADDEKSLKTDDKSHDGNDNVEQDDEKRLKPEENKEKDDESDLQSDFGLAMSVHSADDQSESELIIDMDRADQHITDSVTKEISTKECVKNPDKEAEQDKDDKLTDTNDVESNIRTDIDSSTNIENTDTECASNLRLEVVNPNDTASILPKLTPKLQQSDIKLAPSSIIPSVLASPTLASRKLAAIVQQKEAEEQNMLVENKMHADESNPRTEAENKTHAVENNPRTESENKMHAVENNPRTESENKVDVAKTVSVTDSKDGVESKEEEEVEYPLIEEDPFKVWGTADKLLDRYASQISKCVKESLTDTRRGLIESIISVDTRTKIEQLQSQVTRLKWEKEKQKRELQHIMDLTIAEMRESLNSDLKTCELNTKKEAQREMEKAINETKKRQWCAQCEQEAFFYCCWNTSYCSYPCQQKHWVSHQKQCQQSVSQAKNETPQVTPQSVPTIQGSAIGNIGNNTIKIVTTQPTSNNASTIVGSSNSAVDRLRLFSTQTTLSQAPPIQIVQTAPTVTAAQTNSTLSPRSVQTLIRYVQAPSRVPQPVVQGHQPSPQIIRLPVSAVPATLQNVGGQQRLVLTSQTIQNLKAKQQAGSSVPNVYNN